MDDYYLDADRIYSYESYSPTLFHLSEQTREPEGPSLPFGFTPEGSALLGPRERWQRWFD